MEKSLVDYCKKVGNQIGYYSAQKDSKTLLYDLQRCKRFDKFLDVLDRIKKRIPELSTDLEFFYQTDQTNWREYKALIGIFAKDQEFKVTYARSKSSGSAN
ncbi:MAG: hypothetical protein HYU39_00615 [Thaumarchaeota archaeon]|nr:hypothetical protein [Nitrososphaerota archaeon]